MKKCLLFFIILLMCSGCAVKYNLDIGEDFKFDESIRLDALNDVDKEKLGSFHQYIPVNFDVDDASVFEKKFSDIKYYKIKRGLDFINFSYSHNITGYHDSYFIRNCYQHVTIMEKNKDTKRAELLLSTSNKFLCFEKYDNLDDVKVTITSKYKLKDTNADEVEKHKYTWNITRDNASNKYLYLLLDTTNRDLTLWEKILEGEYTNIFTVSLLIFLVGLFIYFILKKKGDWKNRV